MYSVYELTHYDFYDYQGKNYFDLNQDKQFFDIFNQCTDPLTGKDDLHAWSCRKIKNDRRVYTKYEKPCTMIDGSTKLDQKVNWHNLARKCMSIAEVSRYIDLFNERGMTCSYFHEVNPAKENYVPNSLHELLGTYMVFQQGHKYEVLAVIPFVDKDNPGGCAIACIKLFSDPEADGKEFEVGGNTALVRVKQLYARKTKRHFRDDFGLKENFHKIEGALPEDYLLIRKQIHSAAGYYCYYPTRKMKNKYSKLGAKGNPRAGAEGIFYHCFKMDISSAYPSQVYRLPYYGGNPKIVRDGRASEDHPFAIFLQSGHVEIYGELKTWDFQTANYNGDLIFDHLKSERPIPGEDVLLLEECPADLLGVMQTYYKKRKDNPTAKAVMNMSIGAMHSKKSSNEAIIPLVAHVRNVKRITDFCKEIVKRGGRVVMVQVDAVTWEGCDMSDMVVKEKSLGAQVLEHEDVAVAVRACTMYQILKKDGTLINKISGYSLRERQKLQFGDIYNMGSRETNWFWDPTENRLKEKVKYGGI